MFLRFFRIPLLSEGNHKLGLFPTNLSLHSIPYLSGLALTTGVRTDSTGNSFLTGGRGEKSPDVTNQINQDHAAYSLVSFGHLICKVRIRLTFPLYQVS